MKSISILKHNLMRATMTLALMVTCATAWATDVQTYYIDENGTSYNVTATVLTGSETSIGTAGETTWYVVNSDITYNGKISYLGNPSLILADGKTMTVINNGDEPAIQCLNSTKLTIYGQTLGSGSLVASSASGKAAIQTPGNIEIYGGHVSATGRIGIEVQYIYIKGGSVSATGTLQGITAWRFYVYGGQVTAMGGEGYKGIQSSNNITIGWRRTSDFITWNGYSSDLGTVHIMDDKTFYAGATAYHDDGSGSGVSIPDGTVTLRPYSSDDLSVNEAGTEYTIHTAAGWGYFCDAIDGGESFSGKTVKLDANISVSHCAGSGTDEEHAMDEHPFCGTFNGQGYKITFNYGDPNDPLFGSSGNPSTEDYIAPFRYVKNATIEHLHIDGTIHTCHKHSAGLVGLAYGTTNITDCRSSVNIISSINGDGTLGGIMSCSWAGSTTNIEGCLFDGSIQSADGYTTDQCGGFVGWKNATINVTNSLLTADLSTIGAATGETYPSATFVRHGIASDITNCYYVTALGTEQGKQRHSITEGENVTVAHSGTATAYATSGITAYKDGNTQLPGLLYNNEVLYAGNGDAVSLTLTNTAGEAPTGYQLNYTANNGGTITSSGNSYTLAMPNDDVTISASFSAIPWSGSGTSTEPYIIMYPSQLDLLAYRVNGTHGYTAEADGFSGKYFKLNNNIEYSYTSDWNQTSSDENNYEAIGYYGGSSEDRPFKGDFDGNNMTVSGIRIYKSGTGNTDQNQGLFGYIEDANIHDLTLADARITGYKDSGGIVGSNHGTVTYCQVEADVAIQAVMNQAMSLGGIAGRNYFGCTISHCTSAATISIAAEADWYYGGIVGVNGQSGILSDNFVVGATIPAAAGNRHGAICGFNNSGTLARNYYNACTVAGVENATGVGCGYESGNTSPHDITTNDGAIPVFALTLGEYVTASTTPNVCYNETGYYKSGTIITLGYTNLPESSSLIGYNVNGTSISGNTFPMPDEDATVTVELCNTPPSFGGIYGTITSHGITVSWTGSSESYTLQYRKDEENDWTEIPNITSSPYTIDNLEPGTEYLARMVGNCGNISTGPSREYRFTTLGLCPVPDYLFIKNISSSGASLVWRADNDSYNIKLQKQLYLVTADFETGDFSQFNNVSIVSFTNDANYPWTVVANTHSGAYCAKSGNAGVGSSTSELELVVNLTSPQWLSFSAKVSSEENSDKAYFYIDGEGQYPFDGYGGDRDWANYWFNLSAGQHILRWKYEKDHFENELDDCFYVDDIVITDGLSEVGTYTSSTKNYRFTGLEPRTGYSVQVQGVCNNTPTDWSEMVSFATVPKGSITVEGYLEDDYANGNQWVFIASPVVGSIAPSEVSNLLGENISLDPEQVFYNFDLYRLNPLAELEWENYHQHNTSEHPFMLENGQGYLYASSYTKTLVFAGTFNTDASMDVPLQQGWNLVGNPFADPATVNRNYYRMNATGSAIEPVDISQNNESIVACTGIVVKAEATETDPTITFTRVTTQQSTSNNKGGLQIALAQTVTTRGGSSTETIDNAIVSFNEGSQLGKFYFGTQNANIYLPQDGEEYAIVSAGNVGEIPVNFKAHENGTYTLTVSSTLNSQLSTLNFHYLHLIDNMTGADVDLLTTTEYTFNAKVTDYESRFKLVFMANGEDGSSTGSETFAFYSNGSWIIANEGRATLQVIDLNGRILSSETVNGSVSKSIHAAPGVYMIRLINGNDVKVQKVVIE